jgi:hypothetical protein
VEKVLETLFAKGTFPKKSEAIEFDDEYNAKALEELKRALDKKSK